MGRVNRTPPAGGWLLSLVLVTAFSFSLQIILAEALPFLWLNVLVLFLAGKLAADVVSWIIKGSLSFTYFEDYLKEIIGFSIIALGAAAIVHFSQIYIGGTVWLPLLTGAVITIWNR